MRILSGLTLFFYTLVFLLMGGIFIAISMGVFSQEAIGEMLNTLYMMPNMRLILGLTGVLFILISVMVMRIGMGKIQREKTIAFDNPDGQVTISLTAIEDFIKRAIKQLPEVKELRPNVRADKKGIEAVARVTLFSDVNIPETTEKIQNIVKTKVQDMLGVEEPIVVRVHVGKIVHKEDAQKEPRKDERAQKFRGNIEYSSY